MASSPGYIDIFRQEVRKLRMQSPDQFTTENMNNPPPKDNSPISPNPAPVEVLLRIALSQTIIQPILSNLVTEQSIACGDASPDPSIIGFSAQALLEKYTTDAQKVMVGSSDPRDHAPPPELCWILNHIDIENILTAQRRVIIRLNQQLKRLHPEVTNGAPETNGWRYRGKELAKVIQSNVRGGLVNERNAERGVEAEDEWLEVRKSLNVEEVSVGSANQEGNLCATKEWISENEKTEATMIKAFGECEGVGEDQFTSSTAGWDEAQTYNEPEPEVKIDGHRRMWDLPVSSAGSKQQRKSSTDVAIRLE